MSRIEYTSVNDSSEITVAADVPRVAIQVSREVVVASIQVDLDDDVLARFREDLLQRVHDTGSRGVILDISGLATLDSHEFAALRRIMTTSEILGAESVLVGMRPGVVSALIEAEADVDGLRAAFDLDAAYAMLEQSLLAQPETRDDVAPGQDCDPPLFSQDALPGVGGQE